MCHISGLGVSATCLPCLLRWVGTVKLGGVRWLRVPSVGPESIKLGMTGGSLMFLLVGPLCFYAGPGPV